ncbi:hypothetical protein EU537_12750 [Candidatus Thorarchaeota archaeon]|nr:MAG: hypothetical protein EU537_12750 [Candidatus Thorarchaeota archaeon]
MSRTDLFSRYSQIYRKSRAKEIVPDGLFVRQLADLPRYGMNIGIFFKEKGLKKARQIFIGEPLPFSLSSEEGFFEAEDDMYLTRTIISEFKQLDYLKISIASGSFLEQQQDRIQFLKRCQGIVDTLLRKTRNIVHFGSFKPLLYARKIRTLDEFLKKAVKLDDVSREAARIPFDVAEPEYILLSGNDLIVMKDEPQVHQGVYHFVGGIGYTFDKKVGAVNEEQMFRPNVDWTSVGIDAAYVEANISRVTEDFQTNIHSLIFSDIWKKVDSNPVAVNIDKNLLIKPEPSSDIWAGVFEVYLKPPE